MPCSPRPPPSSSLPRVPSSGVGGPTLFARSLSARSLLELSVSFPFCSPLNPLLCQGMRLSVLQHSLQRWYISGRPASLRLVLRRGTRVSLLLLRLAAPALLQCVGAFLGGVHISHFHFSLLTFFFFFSLPTFTSTSHQEDAVGGRTSKNLFAS